MISPIEVAPASAPNQIKVIRVTQNARKQVVFVLTDDAGRPVDLKAEVQNPPAPPPEWENGRSVSELVSRVRLRTQTPRSELYGSYMLDVPGTLLDDRGFVSFQLEQPQTCALGIFECFVEQYLDDGADGLRVDTWPVLLAVEPTAMGLLSSPSNGPLLIPEVRLALMDMDNQNGGAPFSNLLDDVEFQDVDIVFAQRRVVQLWNETPPPVSIYTTSNFPYRYWWLIATCAHLLQAGAARYRRNRLDYQAGGVAINDQSKADEYEAIAQQHMERFTQWMRAEKYRINQSFCWGIGI